MKILATREYVLIVPALRGFDGEHAFLADEPFTVRVEIVDSCPFNASLISRPDSGNQYQTYDTKPPNPRKSALFPAKPVSNLAADSVSS